MKRIPVLPHSSFLPTFPYIVPLTTNEDDAKLPARTAIADSPGCQPSTVFPVSSHLFVSIFFYRSLLCHTLSLCPMIENAKRKATIHRLTCTSPVASPLSVPLRRLVVPLYSSVWSRELDEEVGRLERPPFETRKLGRQKTYN